jgi:hypothetical protein
MTAFWGYPQRRVIKYTKEIMKTETAIASVVLMIIGGIAALLGNHYYETRLRPEIHTQSLSEIQLEKYKEAEKQCGVDNVQVVCVDSRCADSTKFSCNDWSIAALGKEGREEFYSKVYQNKIEQYCDYYARYGMNDSYRTFAEY